ncbi:MAG TPA: redoxin domain-containing protein [Planctomycetota bacterium]|nr:redoxin domain-containing protein [Planctomycetota bacterium]
MRLALVVMAGLGLAATSPRGELTLGEVVPDVAFKAYDGLEYKLSDFRADSAKKVEGQVVVVYFQSEKCPAAIDPALVKKISAPWNDPKSGVKLLAFYAYGHDTEANIEKFVKANQLPYVNAWDTDRKLRDHFGAKQVNTTFVLDKTGKLVYRGGFAVMKGTKTATKETVVEAVKAAKDGSAAPKSDARFAG